jgi:hypothetical protein
MGVRVLLRRRRWDEQKGGLPMGMGMGMGMGMDTEPHKSTALILKKSFTILGGSVALILFFFNMLMFEVSKIVPCTNTIAILISLYNKLYISN